MRQAARLNYPAALDVWLQKLSIWVVCLLTVYSETVGHFTLMFIGGFNLTVAEPALALCFSAIILRLLSGRALSTSLPALLTAAFIAIFLVSLFRGVLVNSYGAVFSLRFQGVFFICFALGMLFKDKEEFRRAAQSAIYFSSMALAVLVYLRLAAGPGLFRIAFEEEGRPLTSQGGVLLAAGALQWVSLHLQTRQRLFSRYTFETVFLVVALLATRQGTATFAALGGIAVLIAFEDGYAKHLRRGLIMVALTIVFFVWLIDDRFLSFSFILGSLGLYDADTLTQRVANADLRAAVWSGALEMFNTSSFLDQAIGRPLGDRPIFWVYNPAWGGEVEWQNSFHSMYIGTLITGGILGTVLFCLILLVSAAKVLPRILYDRPTFRFFSAPLALSFIVTMLLFSYSYELKADQGLLLALCASGVSRAYVRGNRPRSRQSKMKHRFATETYPLETHPRFSVQNSGTQS